MFLLQMKSNLLKKNYIYQKIKKSKYQFFDYSFGQKIFILNVTKILI